MSEELKIEPSDKLYKVVQGLINLLANKETLLKSEVRDIISLGKD
jgi:hypothetical protein